VFPPRWLVVGGLGLLSLALHVALMSRLGLPGATPDLVLLFVVAIALADGPMAGLACGFVCGLALDLIPPADHTVGRYALVLTLVGYFAGLAREEAERSMVMPFAVVGVAAVGSTGLAAVLGALFSEVGVPGRELFVLLPTAALYTLLLSPFVVPVVLALLRRADSEPLRPDPARRW
jgi:rod shape-determining protein MreD